MVPDGKSYTESRKRRRKMILSDKITDLRKKNGWSQEELANRLEISRQSVSKWESAMSIPDLDKILKLSEIFGVSTDYLLKDDIEPESMTEGMTGGADDTDCAGRPVFLEEANEYMDIVREMAKKISLGVALCILSPIPLICLSGILADETWTPEGAINSIGVVICILLVANAVRLFIFSGNKLKPYDFLETEPLKLMYGVKGVVEKRKAQYESNYIKEMITGVTLCIVSVIPVILMPSFWDSGTLNSISVSIMLALVAAGVLLIVRNVMIMESFKKLLEEEDYTREQKQNSKRNEIIGTIYWCVVTAIYLAWSFITMDWGRTWIIWPCAGALFGAVSCIGTLVKKK